MQQQVDAASQGRFHLSGTNCIARLVQRDQRRRARRVDRHARSAQVEQIRDAVGRDAQRIAGGGIRIHHAEVVDAAVAVVLCCHADEHCAVLASHLLGRMSRMLERFPGQLEKQALLRIHLLRFAWRDAEELRVEARHVVDDAGCEGVALPGFALGGVLIELGTEAVGWHLGHGIGFGNQKPPVILRAMHSSRKPTRHSDYSDCILHLLNLLDFCSACGFTLPPWRIPGWQRLLLLVLSVGRVCS